jgi:hypothetical protein
MLTHNARLVGTGSAEFLEKHEFLDSLSMLQCDGRFVALFRCAAVGVNVDEVEGCAAPVFGNVGVGEFGSTT